MSARRKDACQTSPNTARSGVSGLDTNYFQSSRFLSSRFINRTQYRPSKRPGHLRHTLLLDSLPLAFTLVVYLVISLTLTQLTNSFNRRYTPGS